MYGVNVKLFKESVRINGEQRKRFDIKSGVREECVLYVLLVI